MQSGVSLIPGQKLGSHVSNQKKKQTWFRAEILEARSEIPLERSSRCYPEAKKTHPCVYQAPPAAPPHSLESYIGWSQSVEN